MSILSEFFPADTSRESLLAAQKLVSGKVLIEDDFIDLKLIGGVDQAFMDDKIISLIVVLDYNSLKVIDKSFSVQAVNYPYIPTFLSFREGPAIVSAFKELKTRPDILMVDGAGINHPRRAGIATHIGVALDMPTIGITKNILCGSGKEPSSVGEASPLTYKGRNVGWLLKSSVRSRSIIVAPGHRVSLDRSLVIVKACLRGYRLPEPVRLAHDHVGKLKKELFHSNGNLF